MLVVVVWVVLVAAVVLDDETGVDALSVVCTSLVGSGSADRLRRALSCWTEEK